MFDFHMHSTISYDGHSTPEKMVKAAVKAGLKEMCFTDHLDYQRLVPREQTTFTVDAYRQAYDNLEIPGLTIRRGAEVALMSWNKEEMEGDLQKYPYDFVIGSIHFIDDEDIYYPEFWTKHGAFEGECLYFEEMLKNVQLHQDFDVLGHITYISKLRARPSVRVIPPEDHMELVVAIMEDLISKGKGMEINTSGVDRCGDFLPGLAYLKLFKELGGEIITVGSDAHNSDRVGQYCSDAIALAKEVFGYVCTFEKRQPIFHKL